MRSGIGNSRKGLAQVVTTLMLLAFSILLSGVAIYYSLNIVSVRLQTEDVRLTKQEIWVNSSGAVGAVLVQNLGGKDLLIDKIEVRGVEQAWTTVWFYRVAEGTSVSDALNVTHYDNLTGSPTIDGRQYTQGSSDLPLASGRDMILYLKGPDNVQVQDIGTTISISLFTMNAQYVTECNVKSAT